MSLADDLPNRVANPPSARDVLAEGVVECARLQAVLVWAHLGSNQCSPRATLPSLTHKPHLSGDFLQTRSTPDPSRATIPTLAVGSVWERQAARRRARQGECRRRGRSQDSGLGTKVSLASAMLEQFDELPGYWPGDYRVAFIPDPEHAPVGAPFAFWCERFGEKRSGAPRVPVGPVSTLRPDGRAHEDARAVETRR